MEQYETIHDFCRALGLNNSQVEEWARTLNTLWMSSVDSDNRCGGKFEKHLEEAWQAGALEVRGVSDWIVDLLKAGSKVKPPIRDGDGTAIILKSRERSQLIRSLEIAYSDLVITALQLAEQHGQEAVNGCGSAEELSFIGTKIKLLWTLLGLSPHGHDFTDFNAHKLVRIKEYTIIRETSRDARGDFPDRLVELNGNTKIKLL